MIVNIKEIENALMATMAPQRDMSVHRNLRVRNGNPNKFLSET